MGKKEGGGKKGNFSLFARKRGIYHFCSFERINVDSQVLYLITLLQFTIGFALSPPNSKVHHVLFYETIH